MNSVPLKQIATVIAATALLQGCISNPPQRGDHEFAAAAPRPVMQVPQNTGSIYRAGNEIVLFEDRKARRAGDILTVVLSEKTDASKKATTNTSKDNEVTISPATVLGSALEMKSKNLIQGLDASLTSEQAFGGSGDSKQNNSLTGTISVTVSEVLPNGNLKVSGEKWLQLNQGEEYIRISGIVRPLDIGSDNTVLSTQIADAHIAYSGKGAVADSNAMGWLSRFFVSAIWPF